MYKKKMAITLFITLAVIVAMLSLVGVVFGYLTKAREKAIDKIALIEANVLFADARDTLDKFIGKSVNITKLKNIYTTPIFLADTKGQFSMSVNCLPAQAGVPITWFKSESGANNRNRYDLARTVFDDIVLKYDIKNPSKLLNLLSNSLNSEYIFKFGVEGRLKKAGVKLSYSSFSKILHQYVIEEDDSSVYKVKWGRYFKFGDDFKQIDGNFLNSRLISIIFGIDEQIVKEDFEEGHLKKFLAENGADVDFYTKSGLFATKAVAVMKCKVRYKTSGKNYIFSFKYNNKKVSNFDFIW